VGDVAGTYGCAVGAGVCAPAHTEAVAAGRAAAGGRAEVLRRDSLGALDGRAVERVAAPIREPDDVLAAVAGLGSRRDIARAVARVPGRAP
jgi:hypothetical protein